MPVYVAAPPCLQTYLAAAHDLSPCFLARQGGFDVVLEVAAVEEAASPGLFVAYVARRFATLAQQNYASKELVEFPDQEAVAALWRGGCAEYGVDVDVDRENDFVHVGGVR